MVCFECGLICPANSTAGTVCRLRSKPKNGRAVRRLGIDDEWSAGLWRFWPTRGLGASMQDGDARFQWVQWSSLYCTRTGFVEYTPLIAQREPGAAAGIVRAVIFVSRDRLSVKARRADDDGGEVIGWQ